MSGFLIVKNGTTVAPLIERRGDFEQWFARGMELGEDECRVVRPYAGDVLPSAEGWRGVVLTGSPAMVTDEEGWSTGVEAWLRDVVAAGTPLLGICYGHQQIARAFGGRAGWNPKGRELGTYAVRLTEAARTDPLTGGLGPTVDVHESHSQSVLELPPDARLLAANDHDPHQGFALFDRVWSFQFHPEFDADIVRGYVDDRAEDVRAEGLDPDRLRATARDSDAGPRLLAGFARLARQRTAERSA